MRELQAIAGATITETEPADLAPHDGDGASVASPGRRYVWLMVALGLGGYSLDQITKFLAEKYLDPANPPSFFGGFLKLRLIYNPGAAFSLGSSATVVLTCISIAALIAVIFYAAPRARGILQSVIVGFLLAGILGNLTDRLFRAPGPFRGHVVDFFSLPNFAIFNVADIFITSAAVLIVLVSVLHPSEPGQTGKNGA